MARAPAPLPRIAIVVSERAANGARLVAIDEHGDRQFELVQPAEAIARDTHPAISPDGRWVVFASSRGRRVDETSLWIAPLAADAQAVQLTTGAWIDAQPTWTRDGSAIVFGSTRESGRFDLYRLPLRDGRASGEAERLTSAPGLEITPNAAIDGTVIYTSIEQRGTGVDSHLERRTPDGAIQRVTDGPADSSPALSPDGRTLAFVRPTVAGDGELWTMPAMGGQPKLVVELPQTDEGGPVWSRDGRFLFATSLLRGDGGKPLFSSVIVIDMQQKPRVARVLEDRVGATPRLTPAIAADKLDASAIAHDPEYVSELARIVEAAIAAEAAKQP